MTLTEQEQLALIGKLAETSRALAKASGALGQARRQYDAEPTRYDLRHALVLARKAYDSIAAEYERIYKELNP